METNIEKEISLLTQLAGLGDFLFWKYTCNSKDLMLSEQFCRYFNLPETPVTEEQKSISFLQYIDAIDPDERHTFKDIVYGNSDQEHGVFVYRVSVSDQVCYHTCKYSTITENDQKFVIGIITDTTNQAVSERKLKKKEFILDYVIGRVELGVYIWNPISDEVNINSKWYQNFGLKPNALFKNSLKEFIARVHPTDRGRIQFVCDQFLTRETKFMDEEFRICVNNSIRWVRYTVLSYTPDAMDSIRLIGINQDITSIKRQEERNTKIMDAIPDFIFIFDDKFYIRDLLKSDEIVLLHPLEELLGANGRDIFSPEVSDIYSKTILKCLTTGNLQEIEYHLDASDGRHYFQARMVPYEGDKVMALIHNIGDRVRRTQELIQAKQKAEEADKMKSAFLANMSHEIRTPLNAIVGFSEIVATSEDPEAKAMYMDIIKTNSSILLQLINDILDLSRIESGKTEISIRKIELNEIIEEVAHVHRLKMKDDIKLKVEHPESPVWIMSDANRVNQVLFNFMSNAIKNTEAGHITLSLSLNNDQVYLSVHDTGRGIPQDKLDSIFERFTKLNDFVQGTGLGLTICQTIATKLNGCIKVESRYGQGSTFSLVLPYTTTENQNI